MTLPSLSVIIFSMIASKKPLFARSPWRWPNNAWNLFCILSVIGIWPRFIEPKRLRTKAFSIPIKNLPKSFNGLSVVQLSDLHLQPSTSTRFLKKISKKVLRKKPDIIVITGDFICQSALIGKERLKNFLNSFNAPLGCYAVLGNHDYSEYIGIDKKGLYTLKKVEKTPLSQGFKLLFSKKRTLVGKPDKSISNLEPHQELLEVLHDSPFQLLRNETVTLEKGGEKFNIAGLGEHMASDLKPEIAFKKWDRAFPGIVLAHNPDALPHLLAHPGDLILSGHTHGGQVNLPFLWKKFTLLENPRLKAGVKHFGAKKLFVNRGLGAVFPFRFFSMPEIVSFKLYEE